MYLNTKYFVFQIHVFEILPNPALNISHVADIVKNMRRNVFCVKQVVFENRCMK